MCQDLVSTCTFFLALPVTSDALYTPANNTGVALPDVSVYHEHTITKY